MLNTVLYVALRLGTRVVPCIPLSWAYRIADLAGTLAYAFIPAARRGILSNLAVALPDVEEVRRRNFAKQALRHDARNWIDTLRIDRVDVDDLSRSVDIDGWEHLEDAVALGRGVIVVTFHLGNIDLVGQLIAARGFNITVPVERMRPRQLFEFLCRQRSSRGIDIVPLERAPRAMLATLRRGELVGIATDRLISGKGEWIEFFGRPTEFPRGPASLARHTGAPVLIGVGLRSTGNRFRGIISDTVMLSRTGDHARDEHELIQSLAGLIEPLIRENPGQWLAFSPIWPARGGESTPATIGQQTEVTV